MRVWIGGAIVALAPLVWAFTRWRQNANAAFVEAQVFVDRALDLCNEPLHLGARIATTDDAKAWARSVQVVEPDLGTHLGEIVRIGGRSDPKVQKTAKSAHDAFMEARRCARVLTSQMNPIPSDLKNTPDNELGQTGAGEFDRMFNLLTELQRQ